jgi:hypothetical protein
MKNECVGPPMPSKYDLLGTFGTMGCLMSCLPSFSGDRPAQVLDGLT